MSILPNHPRRQDYLSSPIQNPFLSNKNNSQFRNFPVSPDARRFPKNWKNNEIKNTIETPFKNNDHHLEIILWNKQKTEKVFNLNIKCSQIKQIKSR